MEFDPWLQFTLIPHHINSEKDGGGGEQDRAVETCRLPFTFTEECWQFLALLSVGGQDKSSVFINKIDGIAYQQFLFCVFPYFTLQSICSGSDRILSAQVQASLGVLTYSISNRIPKPAQMQYSSAQIYRYAWNIPQCLSVVLNENNNETSLCTV